MMFVFYRISERRFETQGRGKLAYKFIKDHQRRQCTYLPLSLEELLCDWQHVQWPSDPSIPESLLDGNENSLGRMTLVFIGPLSAFR